MFGQFLFVFRGLGSEFYDILEPPTLFFINRVSFDELQVNNGNTDKPESYFFLI